MTEDETEKISWYQRVFAPEFAPHEAESSYFVIFVERFFKIRERRTTIGIELRCGVLHFISCAFILAVNPHLLSQVWYKHTISRSMYQNLIKW